MPNAPGRNCNPLPPVVSPLHSFLRCRAFGLQWVQSSSSWWVAVLNRTSPPKVPPAPSLCSPSPVPIRVACSLHRFNDDKEIASPLETVNTSLLRRLSPFSHNQPSKTWEDYVRHYYSNTHEVGGAGAVKWAAPPPPPGPCVAFPTSFVVMGTLQTAND